jgi:hypothetical protein
VELVVKIQNSITNELPPNSRERESGTTRDDEVPLNVAEPAPYLKILVDTVTEFAVTLRPKCELSGNDVAPLGPLQFSKRAVNVPAGQLPAAA